MVTTTRRHSVKKPPELFNRYPLSIRYVFFNHDWTEGMPILKNLASFLFTYKCKMCVFFPTALVLLTNLREPRNQAIINARMLSLNGLKIIEMRE